jgi:protein-tyrosine sulfotransferase
VFRIKYESLVQSPEESLRPLFAFLGVEWDDGLLDRVFEAQHDSGVGDVKVMFSKKIEQSALGKGSGIPSWLIPKDLLAKVNAISKELDYPEINPDSNQAAMTSLPIERGGDKSPDTMSIKDLFESHFPQQIEKNRDSLKPVKSVIKFIVTGEDAGVWTVDLREPLAQIRAEDGSADCSITVSSNDLFKIVNKELNPGECFLQGRLKVEGNIGIGMVVGRAIFEA